MPTTVPMSLYARIGLSLYLALAAALDLRTRRVPNWLTLPVLGIVLVWRAVRLDLAILPYWAGCLAAFSLNWLGGGDAKLLMVLFGLFPRVELFFLFLLVAGVGIAVVLLARNVRARSVRAWLGRTWYRLSRLHILPSGAQMETAAEPFTLFISLAGLAYVWAFA